LGVLLQLVALSLLFKLIKPHKASLMQNNSRLTLGLFGFAILGLVLKIVLQSLSFIPDIAAAAYQQRNLVIGFIHLLMLGAITGFLFGFILQSQGVVKSKLLHISIGVFVLGFLLTEILLILQGALLYFGRGIVPNYFLWLFVCSAFLPVGITGIIINILKKR